MTFGSTGRRWLAAVAAGCAAGIGLAACTDDTEPQSDVPATQQTTAPAKQPPSQPPSQTPSQTSGQPSTAPPSPSGATPPTTPATPSPGDHYRSLLLSAGQLPEIEPGSGWTVRSTTTGEGKDRPSQCQQAPWLSIGVTKLVRRDFAGPGRSDATGIVAQFADAQSAGRAESVWMAWNRGCGAYATAHGDTDVRAPGTWHPVDTAAGKAGWWTVAYRPAGRGKPVHNETDGLVRWERHIAFVVITQVGRGSDHGAAQTSMEGALDASAGNLTR
jgi:hypothetical protein